MTGTMTRAWLAFALLAGSTLAAAGTPAKGGERGWRAEAGTHGVQRLVTPGVDRSALLHDDAARARAGKPPRFAQAFPQHITPATHGTWDRPAPGLRRWRLQLES